MPPPDLAPEEYAEVVRLVRAAIDSDRYPLSPRAKRLKSILAKLDPASAERTVTPFPPPKPSGTPSLVYQRLKGGERDRDAQHLPELIEAAGANTVFPPFVFVQLLKCKPQG
jgi:hypothetical protein